jgi:hypothetical protein
MSTICTYVYKRKNVYLETTPGMGGDDKGE